MSWTAILSDGQWWNYTHNTNGMIEAVLGERVATTRTPWWSAMDLTPGLGAHSWWDLLHGASGAEGATLLEEIIRGLESDPDRCRAMNPENGWGDYDGLLGVLREMRAASLEEPDGSWEVSG